MKLQKVGKCDKVCWLKETVLLLLVFNNVSSSYYYFYPCIYICLKLLAAFIEKVAMLYMWNLKEKDDWMNQNIFHICYANYMSTNQQT